MSTVENKNIHDIICNICNKKYKDKSGLWYHNKKYHTNITSEIPQPNIIPVQPNLNNPQLDNTEIQPTIEHTQTGFECTFCKKTYTRNDNLKRHQLTCKLKKEADKKNADNQEKINMQICFQEIEKLKKTIEELQNQKTVINNTFNNTTNIIKICKIGEEDISLLTSDEIKYIKDQGLNAIITIVDQLNFNERLPQNHTFYVGALNGKHINTFDHKTNTIIKQPKYEVFDMVLVSGVQKLETMGKNDIKFNEIINYIKTFIFKDKPKKKYYEFLNTMSYNKRNMIINTWNNLKSNTTLSNKDFAEKLDKEVEQIAEMPDNECKNNSNNFMDYYSDFDSVSDSDSDSESYGKLISTKIKKKKEVEIDV